MDRIKVELSDRPNYEYLIKHPEFGKHPKGDWSWHRNSPSAQNSLTMDQMDPIWKYYLFDHNGQFSRCIYGPCKMCIDSCAPEILAIHLEQKHIPALEHCNLVKLREKLRTEYYCELNERTFEELGKEDKFFTKEVQSKDVQNRLKFQQMSNEQRLNFASATKMKAKEGLKRINKFVLFVNLVPAGNSIAIFISIGAYSFSTYNFCIVHLSVESTDANSNGLTSQIDTAVMKVLVDFELHSDNIMHTFAEGPPELNALCSKLKFQKMRISYRQKLIEFSNKLAKIESSDKSKAAETQKVKKLVASEIDSSRENASTTIDSVIPFISKLQQESEDLSWLLTLISDIFGFVVDPRNKNFCSDYMIAVFLNPQLAIDLDDSCLKVVETVLKSKHQIFTQNAKAIKEFSTWMSAFKVASFAGLNSLLSDSKLTEEDFNPVKFWAEKRNTYPNLSKIARELLLVPAFVLHSKSSVDKWPAGLAQADDFAGNFDDLKLQAMISYNDRFWPGF